jgi:transposase InsO family protein
MPFKETCRMEERIRMLSEYDTGNWSISDLCRRYGICRDTFYEWRKRREGDTAEWFVDHSHAPLHCPHRTEAAISEAVISLRRRFPHLGPRKLRVVLERQAPETCWPAASTIGDILQRTGLITPVKRRRPALDGRRSVTAVTAANDEWAADFKGWFRAGDNSRIDPLTLTDSHSRYLIEVRIVPPTIERSQPVFAAAFRRQGLPRAIRCDNGSPFGSTGAGGLTRLSAWWIKLGIEPHFIHPASPQENGRHERMHRTLKAQTSRPPAANAAEQQERFDTFRRHYNPASQHPSGYVVEGKRLCWSGCDPAGYLGFCRARSAIDRAADVVSPARAKIHGPSRRGWIALISPASAASRSVLGAIRRSFAALVRLSHGSMPSSAGLNTRMR